MIPIDGKEQGKGDVVAQGFNNSQHMLRPNLGDYFTNSTVRPIYRAPPEWIAITIRPLKY